MESPLSYKLTQRVKRMDALLGAIVDGLLAILGGFLAVMFQGYGVERERRKKLFGLLPLIIGDLDRFKIYSSSGKSFPYFWDSFYILRNSGLISKDLISLLQHLVNINSSLEYINWSLQRSDHFTVSSDIPSETRIKLLESTDKLVKSQLVILAGEIDSCISEIDKQLREINRRFGLIEFFKQEFREAIL